MTNEIAYFGEVNIYWHAIFFTVGIVSAILLAWLLRFVQGAWRWNHSYSMWLVTPLSLVLGLLLARAIYCYFVPEILEGGLSEFWAFSHGGFMLYGAVLGVVLAVIITRLVLKRVYISELLDAIAPAGALAICIGRCASYFSGEDLGVIINSPEWQFFPFAVYRDDGFWHLAVFSFEALAAAIAFLASIVIFILVYVRKSEPTARGAVLVTFLMVFSSAQTLLESMRIDSVFFLSLGFVRFNQVISAIVLFGCFVYANVKAIKKFGLKLWIIILWALVVGAFVLAFFKEFKLASDILVSSYTIMGICLLSICLITFVLLCMTLNPQRRKAEENKVESAEETSVDTIEETSVEVIEETSVEVIEETPVEVIEEAPVEIIEEAPVEVMEETPVEIIEVVEETVNNEE